MVAPAPFAASAAPFAPFVAVPSTGALMAASWKWGTDLAPSVCTGDPWASSTRRATSAPSMISLSSNARAMALSPPRCLLNTSIARCSSERKILSTSSSMTLEVSSE